jgi:DNA binding domain, excisionase family|nr:MAG TPA: Serine Recombinase [Caudoviricetes sp.]
MQLISIGKFAKKVGLTTASLRRMHQSGECVPYHITKGGTRYYSLDQLKDFSTADKKEKLVIGYCRVSTSSQKDDLEIQINNVKSYMYAKGYNFEIISDIGSSINYKKKGLQELLDKINDQKISKIIVLYKDRLIGFGFELIEYLCKINNIEIEIIDNTKQSKEQELSDNLIQIVTVFANQLYGQCSKKTKQLINGVKQNVFNKKD